MKKKEERDSGAVHRTADAKCKTTAEKEKIRPFKNKGNKIYRF